MIELAIAEGLLWLLVLALVARELADRSTDSNTMNHKDHAKIDFDAPMFQGTNFADEVKEALDTNTLSINGIHADEVTIQESTGKNLIIEISREGSPVESVADWSEVELYLTRDGDYAHVLEVDKIVDKEIENTDLEPKDRTYTMTLRAKAHRRRGPGDRPNRPDNPGGGGGGGQG